MDPEQMVNFHIESGAGATVAGIRVPRMEARLRLHRCRRFGTDPQFRGEAGRPAGTPDNPDQTFVSMGNTCSPRRCSSTRSARTLTTTPPITTWGGNIIPNLVEDGLAAVL